MISPSGHLCEKAAYSIKAALITGAASGLGQAMAETLLPDFDRILTIDRVSLKSDKLNSSAKVRFHKLDLSSPDDIARASELIREYPIRLLINNAAIYSDDSIIDLEIARVVSSYYCNTIAPIALTQAALQKAYEADTTLTVVNIASNAINNIKKNESIYVSTKAALVAFAEACRREVGCKHRIFTVLPGGLKTNLYAMSGAPKNYENYIAPEKAAKFITSLIMNSECTSFTFQIQRTFI